MSWWTKNRKYVGLLAAAAAAATGVGAPAVAGLLGTGAAGAGAAGAAGAGAAGAAGAGAAGAGAAELASMAALPEMAGGLLGGAAPQSVGVVPSGLMGQMFGQYAGTADKALGGLGKASQVMGIANSLSPQQPPQQPPPMPAQRPVGPMPIPGDEPPPGIDPAQWATLDPETKRRMKQGAMQ